MASKNYYTATWLDSVSGELKKCTFSGKDAAVKHGATIATQEEALVRVATPAGALVRYFDGRVKA
jgi:hypothetical protein